MQIGVSRSNVHNIPSVNMTRSCREPSHWEIVIQMSILARKSELYCTIIKLVSDYKIFVLIREMYMALDAVTCRCELCRTDTTNCEGPHYDRRLTARRLNWNRQKSRKEDNIADKNLKNYSDNTKSFIVRLLSQMNIICHFFEFVCIKDKYTRMESHHSRR